MLIQALRIALSIMFFRAGPQDMPYDQGPRLTRSCALLAAVVYALFWANFAPPLAAVVLAAMMVSVIGVTTRAVLTMRKLENRFQQTYNAIMLSGTMLVLAALPVLAIIAPPLIDYLQHNLQDPKLANHPEQWPDLPEVSEGAALLFDLLMLWLFVVSARIYGQSIDAGVFGGVLITLLALSAIMLGLIFVSPLVNLLAG